MRHPEPDIPTNRLNDGKVSPDGRFWAGTMDDRPDKEPIGALYRLDPDHGCSGWRRGVIVSNGLAWSPDGRMMYHSDSRGGAIWRYDYDPADRRVGERDVFVTMQPEWGRPDGGAVDEEGCYWSCGIAAGRSTASAPRGELIELRRAAGHASDHAVLRRARPHDALRHVAARDFACRRLARRRRPAACSRSSPASRARRSELYKG